MEDIVKVPSMDYENEMALLVKKMVEKRVTCSKDMKLGDKYKIMALLIGNDEALLKKLKTQQNNYKKLGAESLPVAMVNAVVDFFCTSLWWDEVGDKSEEKFMNCSPPMQEMKKWMKRTERLQKECKEAWEYAEACKEEKGMITEEEHQTCIKEAKEVVHIARDEERIKLIKRQRELEKKIADMKREHSGSHLTAQLKALECENGYLKSENEEMKTIIASHPELQDNTDT